MPWFRRGDGQLQPGDKDKLDDVEFSPEKLKTEITTEFKTQLDASTTAQDAKFKPLFAMAEQIQADRDERKKQADDAAKKKTAEENELGTDDFLLDPLDATRRAMAPTNNAVLMLAAKMARTEYLGDKEYYHGDIKSAVDKMIEAQPLHMRSRADVLENAYKIACFDAQKEIADGKIKSRNNAANFEGGSTGAHSADSKEGAETLTAEEKFVAGKMGISEKDWATSRKELSYV